MAEAAESIDAEVIVNLQGDEPLLGSAALEALVRAFLEDDVPMGTLVARITDPSDAANPARVKMVGRHDGRALCVSRAGIPFRRDDDGPGDCVWHIGVYICRKYTDDQKVTPPLHQVRPPHAGHTTGTVVYSRLHNSLSGISGRCGRRRPGWRLGSRLHAACMPVTSTKACSIRSKGCRWSE